MVNVQVGELPLHGPVLVPELHFVKVPPVLGVAVRVTCVPEGNTKPQTEAPSVKSVLQLMPAGLLVIEPPPDTAVDNCGGSPQPVGYAPGGGV